MATNEATAWVSGSTRYVGQAVVRELCNAGARAVAHVRPGSRRGAALRAEFEAMGARVVECAWTPEALREALEADAPTHLFCLIGTTRKQAKSEGLGGDIYDRIDRGLAVMLAEAAKQVAPNAKYIYLSSIGASPSASSKYLKARGEAEAAIASSGLAYLSARPSFITGPDREESRPGERIGAAVANGLLATVAALGGKATQTKYASTTASALAERLVALGLGDAHGIREGRDLSLSR